MTSSTLPTLSVLGTSAVLFEAPGEMTLPTQQRIWALAQRVQQWEGIREAVPGMNNLMVTFATAPHDLSSLQLRLLDTWSQCKALSIEGRIVELPVIYGGDEYGPHLRDVVAHTGLSIDDIVTLHTAPLYPVYALGSHPGFCYLGGMDSRLATPRRQVPITHLPGGAVSIGGIQTGVSASEGPSGWNTIGRTRMNFFDVTQTPPALCAPGDHIRFCIERVIR